MFSDLIAIETPILRCGSWTTCHGTQFGAYSDMSGYELCIGTDQPGDGVQFDTMADARTSGWESVGPIEAHEALAVPIEAFFTIHEIHADGASSIVVFDSRNDYADA
jgi:hypothetical protein